MSTETQAIPDDAVAKTVDAIFADPSNFLTEEAAKAVVALAITVAVAVERERCAAVADWYSQAAVHAEWTDESRGAGYYACADVARDIRFPKPIKGTSPQAFDAGDDLPF